MSTPYFIIECANTHGGDFTYLTELVSAFKDLTGCFGIKFQAFHPDQISTEDYSAHKLYHELHFTRGQWRQVIELAAQSKDIWLDIFDGYGVDVLRDNHPRVRGIKFQSSVLHNREVFGLLKKVDLTGKVLILNLAAREMDEIQPIIDRVTGALKPGELWLELGYQAYPTRLEDSGLSKIATIRERHDNPMVFADHVDGASEDALWLPVAAVMAGARVIEKHAMLEGRETKYDHFSSVTPARFGKMVENVQRYARLLELPFINTGEREYLAKTRMIPILVTDRPAGSTVNLERDVSYRRCGRPGLGAEEIEVLQKDLHVLATCKKAGQTLLREDFKRATIATIIACRLKSTRLPRKALLKIGELTSVERCIQSCLEFEHVNHTVLATSTAPEDEELGSYTYRPEVIFHRGDPDDVIRRYLDIADALRVDVVVRVTADCPFVSHEIIGHLLASHFQAGADYTAAREASVGTAGEIINRSALQKVKEHFPSANYSEYMTWYFRNNPEHFRLNIVDLPVDLVRDYRLTLDYPEDLEMFNRLQNHFDQSGNPFDIRKAFDHLDGNPEIPAINSHLTLRYKSDPELIATLDRVTKIPI